MLRQSLRCFRSHSCSLSRCWNHSRCSCLGGCCARNSSCRRGYGGRRSCRCASRWSGRSCAVRDTRDRRSQADGGTLLRVLRRRCLRGRGALHAARAWEPSRWQSVASALCLLLRFAAGAAAKSNGACVLHTAAGAPASLLRVCHTVAGLLEAAVLAHVVDTDRTVVLAAGTAPSGLALRRGSEVRTLLLALLTHLTRAKE